MRGEIFEPSDEEAEALRNKGQAEKDSEDDTGLGGSVLANRGGHGPDG